MVQKYKRKTDRGSWKLSRVQQAAQAVCNGKMSISEDAAAYRVPKSTLKRHKNRKVQALGCLERFHTTLDAEFEKELDEYCCEMQDRLFGLTSMELRSLAFELAEKNGISTTFNRQKRIAGKDWLHGFLSRHNQLSI